MPRIIDIVSMLEWYHPTCTTPTSITVHGSMLGYIQCMCLVRLHALLCCILYELFALE